MQDRSLKTSLTSAADLFLPIIPIDSPQGDYDPCDVSTISKQSFAAFKEQEMKSLAGSELFHQVLHSRASGSGVEPLRVEDGLNLRLEPNTTEEIKWIALVRDTEVFQTCGHIPYQWYYVATATFHAQQLGASALLFVATHSTELSKGMLPPGVDSGTGDYNGVALTIPVLTVRTANLPDSDLLFDSSSAILLHALKGDANPFDFIFEPFGINRMLYWTMLVVNVGLAIRAALVLKAILEFYQGNHKKGTKNTVKMRLLILIPQIIAAVSRTLVAVDPVGIFGTFDFIFARSIMNFSATVGTFGDIAMIFFSIDVLNTYKSSGSLRAVKPCFQRYPFVQTLIFIGAALMVVIDQAISLLSLTASPLSVGSSILIPGIYQIINHLVFTVVLVSVSCIVCFSLPISCTSN